MASLVETLISFSQRQPPGTPMIPGELWFAVSSKEINLSQVSLEFRLFPIDKFDASDHDHILVIRIKVKQTRVADDVQTSVLEIVNEKETLGQFTFDELTLTVPKDSPEASMTEFDMVVFFPHSIKVSVLE